MLDENTVVVMKLSYVRFLVERLTKHDPSNFALVEEAGFPDSFFTSEQGYIPIDPFHQFIRLLASKHQPDELIEVFSKAIRETYVPNVLFHIDGVLTVREALQKFVTVVKQESRYTRVEIEVDSYGNATLQRDFPHGSEKESLWSETFSIICLWEVIKAMGVKNFIPNRLYFHSTELEPLRQTATFKDIELVGGYMRTGIAIPANVLAVKFNPFKDRAWIPKEQNQSTFVEAISSITELYLGSAGSIKLIAELLDIPCRTLQRKLSEHGTSFREVRNLAMINKAIPLLESGKPLIEVAMELGYGCLPSFSRAFKRITGVTPNAWPKQ